MTRTIIRLAIAVLLLALAAVLLNKRAPERADVGKGPLIAGLNERINAIDEVRISSADNGEIVLSRSDDAWRVQQRAGWPADTGKLRDYLLRLALTQRVEAKTALPENYSRLGVEDTDSKLARGARLDIIGGGEPLALIVGLNNPQGRGSYVRVPDAAQSWLADLDIAPERKAENWLQRDLIDVDPRRIVRIEIKPGKGEAIVLHRAAINDSQWQLDALAKGKQLVQTAVDGVDGFLQGLRLEDVAKAEGEPPADALHARFVTADGLDVGLTLWQHEAVAWGRFTAHFDEDQAMKHASEREAFERAAAKVAPESQSDDDATTTPGIASAQSRVAQWRTQSETFAQRIDGWQFALSPYKVGNLRKPRSAFIEPAK
ncbi:MAG: hypothetical protein CVV16_08635 [Gammaproteobacteria bacterium HGW-Gammaproteobacteria-6]|nr:MAG: hypothetical protein CVV16_08635 [Gammaproteobacteria bacterium HGW-Gammaproteobacteria-6]